MRQEHNAKVVGLRPVEASALHQHDPGFLQQIQKKRLVVFNRIHHWVQAREHVQGSAGFDAAHPRNRGDQRVGQVALAPQAAAFAHQVINALVATQGGLNGELARHIGAQAHVGEHVQALDIVLGRPFVARDHQPAGAVTARAVAFGQRIESQGQHIVAQRANGRMVHTVIQNLVVHLVGKYHQPMLACNRHNTHEQLIRIHRARRVIRVDHHDGLGARRDLGAHIVQVRHPALGLVAQVMHRRAARQAGRRRPQRVVGRGQQHFVTIVQQAIGGHHNQFTGAVAQVNIVQRDAMDALFLRLMHHRFARRKNTLAVGIPRRIGQVANHVLLNLLGRIKAKHRQIANIELDDFLALFLHLARPVHDGAANVVADVGQLG